MGKILLPPLKFILIFIGSALLMMFFILIYNWGQWVSVAEDVKNSLLVFLPAAAGETVYPAVSAALLFTFFDYRRKPVKIPASIITAGVVFIILFFGFRFAASMEYNPDSIAFSPLNSKTIQVTDEALIYTDEISREAGSGIASGVVVRNRDAETPGFIYYKNASVPGGETSVMITDFGKTIDIEPKNPVFSESFRAAGVLENFLADIGFLNRRLIASATEGGPALLLFTAAFTAFLMSCLLFRGATVWPFFDFILILAFHRLVYYLFALFSSETLFISETFFGGRQLENIPLFIIAGFTLILFLSGLLIKLTSRRKTA